MKISRLTGREVVQTEKATLAALIKRDVKFTAKSPALVLSHHLSKLFAGELVVQRNNIYNTSSAGAKPK